MSKLRCHISISVDGFVAGPNQSEENPLGEGGERLHDWVVPLAAWRQSHGGSGARISRNATGSRRAAGRFLVVRRDSRLERIGARPISSRPREPGLKRVI